MSIELRDMRWAAVIAKHRSLRRAAETLNVRESTLSRRLRDLEYRLGTELFERSANGTQLTAAGREFVAVASHIVAEVDSAFCRIKARGRGDRGDLIVGICMALFASPLQEALTVYGKQYEAVSLHSIDGSRSSLLADLNSGDIDLLLTADGHFSWNGPFLPLWSERLMVALPRDHVLCGSDFIRWRDLAGKRILVNRRDPGPDYETMLRERLGDRSGCIFVSQDVSLNHLLGLVAAGLGLTLVSESAAKVDDSRIAARELHNDDGPVRIRFAAYWKETNRNPALWSFLDLLRERYSDAVSSM